MLFLTIDDRCKQKHAESKLPAKRCERKKTEHVISILNQHSGKKRENTVEKNENTRNKEILVIFDKKKESAEKENCFPVLFLGVLFGSLLSGSFSLL